MKTRLLALSVGCALAMGCGSHPDTPKGSLEVTLTSPAGVAPIVQVTGPDGFSKTLNASETLNELAPGTYAVSGIPVTVLGAVVSTVYDATVTGGPVTVAADETAAISVSYSLRIGTGKAWVTDKTANTASGFSADQLAVTGSPAPAVGLGFPAGSQTYGAAFDRAGNLWTLLPGAPPKKIVRLASALLGGSGAPFETASVANAQGPSRLTFDSEGNLWVANSFNNTVAKYLAADLAGSGELPAVPVLTFSSGSFHYPSGLAFDSAGNLWVADAVFTGPPYAGSVFRISADQLGQSGTVTASFAATLDHASIAGPQGLAFDRFGNLWIANFGGATDGSASSLLRFNASQLSGTGAISSAPALTISSSNLLSPNAPSFDEGGNLWIANNSGRTLVRFAASQLVGTGTTGLSAEVVLSGPAGNGYSGLAFNPPPAGLPLYR